jgi:hypothetical protein
MNGISSTDLRGRLVLLFRMLKVDTVITFNPWAPGEEDPDRWVTGRAVEEASAISGTANEYPEYLDAGIMPHPVSERYYFYARPGQSFNRVVDISSHVEKKIDAIVECKSQGGGNSGSLLRARLTKQGRSLPLLGIDDRTADREYVRHSCSRIAGSTGRHTTSLMLNGCSIGYGRTPVGNAGVRCVPDTASLNGAVVQSM